MKRHSDEGSERKEAVGKAFVFLENTYNHVQNVGRNMDSKGHSDEPQVEMRKSLLDNRGKAVLVIKRQRTWLSCVLLVFCEK